MGTFDNRKLPEPPSFNRVETTGTPDFVADAEPLTPSEVRELDTLYKSRLESLQAVDDLVSDLIEELRESGQLRNTYFIYTSDNGFLFGEHRQKGKRVVYEESVRVPFIIRGPDIPHDRDLDQLISNVDIAPTIGALAGVEIPDVDGQSVARELTGERQPSRKRALLLEMLSDHKFKAARAGDFVYVEYRTGEIELYDLARDPYELRNVAGEREYAQAEEDLARALRRLRTCTGSDCSVEVQGR